MYCLDSKSIVFNEHEHFLLPNMKSSLERVILTSWKFVFNQVETKFINATTGVQFQKRCTSVSCSVLQN